MNSVIVGLDYQTATSELRQKLSILESHIESAIAQLLSLNYITQAKVISTDERIEIHAVVSQAEAGIAEIIQFLSQITHLSLLELQKYLFICRNQAATFSSIPFAVGLEPLTLTQEPCRQSLATVPKIASLRNKAEIIREQELEKALSRLGREFTHKHQQVLEILTKNIVNQILQESTIQQGLPRNIETRSIALHNL